MNPRCSALVLLLVFSIVTFTQITYSQDEIITNAEVISLTKAGLDKSVIINKIGVSRTKFDLSTDALVQLKQAGVSDDVIAFMINPKPALPAGEADKKPVRLKDELTTNFNRLKTSVVTVWSEFGSGTGFIFDSSGLILTNQHVVGPSRYIAVQMDNNRKVAATLLSADPERDIAVLWVNLEAFPDATIAKIAKVDPNEPSLSEGERVFTIGSPLNQKKIITTGIVSKIEERAIISDVNINHGNSGGPLFNSIGEAVGVTTFGDFTNQGGPGISGIVRIEQAATIIEEAKKKTLDAPKPSARLLPVEPNDKFPLEAIKEVATAKKFDEKPYAMDIDKFDIVLLTPLLTYRMETAAERAAAKEHEKRNKKDGAVQGSYRPFDEFRGWREYVGEYKPILLIQVVPELGESFWGAFGRGLAANYGIHAQANLHFKSDFHRMRLFCGDTEVEPIQPGKIPFLKNQSDYFVKIQDASFVGFYSYPANAISPRCGKVRLEIFSEKEPDKPHVKELSRKAIEKITEDFEPYLSSRKQ